MADEPKKEKYIIVFVFYFLYRHKKDIAKYGVGIIIGILSALFWYVFLLIALGFVAGIFTTIAYLKYVEKRNKQIKEIGEFGEEIPIQLRVSS